MCHPPFAVCVNVNGSKIRATAAPRMTRPMRSSWSINFHTRLTIDVDDDDLVGARTSCTSPSFFALRSAQKRVTMRGERETGTRIANIPSGTRRFVSMKDIA